MINTKFTVRSSGKSGFLNPEKMMADVGIFEENFSIADFGCGAGYFTIPLAKIVGEKGKIYAIDVLSSALEIVETKAKNEGLHNVIPVRANLEVAKSSKLDDLSQDSVVLANILYQSRATKVEIMTEAKRVLKNGGKLVIIEWNLDRAEIGPAVNLRIPPEVIRQDATSLGLKLDRAFNIDPYHYCLIFKKQ